ncbi:DUF4238 domain-containing protein [Brevibacillus sp. SIMBA_040]|uniref:DUF4238 domain-containing protein n=1 Tax=unclassified Brevibacillus TaxID=2684853 RepID=UPI00397D9982
MGAKYHHLIPQTYLKSWCYSGNSLYMNSKHDMKTSEPRNTASIFGEDHYHSIKVGMPICTEDDLTKIFSPLDGIRVECEGKTLTTLRDYNKFFTDFDDWNLFYPNGPKVPKGARNKIKHEISNCKILDIEEAWSSKYENGWNTLLNKIKQEVLQGKDMKIAKFYKEELMKFVVSLNWRSYTSNEILTEELHSLNNIVDMKGIEIPVEERDRHKSVTVFDDLMHNYLLKKFREFLNEKGVMYSHALRCIRELTIRFYFAGGKVRFLTSDNPSFQYFDKNGFRHHIMPVCPEILISFEKNNPITDNYYVEIIDDETVHQYNSLIVSNSDQFVISIESGI